MVKWRLLRFLCTTVLLLVLVDQSKGDVCKEGEIQQGNGCYRFVSNPQDWKAASERCLKHESHLVAVTHNYMQEFIIAKLKELQWSNSWIGGRQHVTKWKWTKDNSSAEATRLGCYSGGDVLTEEVYKGNSLTGANQLNPVLCMNLCFQKKYASAGVLDGTICKCNATFDANKTADLPDSDCSAPCAGDNNRHCGGSGKTMVYSVKDPYYSNWETASMQESPDNYGGYQPCAYMSMPDLKWGDMSCVEEQAGAICDLGVNTTCNSSQHYYHDDTGRCFFLNDTKISWFEARLNCRTVGGALIKMNTSEEKDLIKKVLADKNIAPNTNFWLGLTTRTWKWDDGESVLYTHWFYGYPTGKKDGDLCIEQHCNGPTCAWKDRPCSDTLPYVCHRAIPTTVEPPVTDTPTKPSDNSIISLYLGIGIACMLLLILMAILLLICFYKYGPKHQPSKRELAENNNPVVYSNPAFDKVIQGNPTV